MLDASRFNRRLHRIKSMFLTLFSRLGEVWKDLNADAIYSLDSFPIAVCDNIRISRAKIYHDNRYRGYIPSKRRYFYGVKVHLIVTATGQPVEFFLTPGSLGDVKALECSTSTPPGSTLYADRAYNDTQAEDELLASAHSNCSRCVRRNSTRRFCPTSLSTTSLPQRVETAGSLIERLLPKSIHASLRWL